MTPTDLTGSNGSSATQVREIDFSHYRPTPDSRQFSISTFAVTGGLSWEAKPAGEFEARIDVLKGAFAKVIPFKVLEASVKIMGSSKVFSLRILGAKNGEEIREKAWSDLSIISPIEIPWVAEYALQRWSVGGPHEMFFTFEDNQRVRKAILFFREGSDDSASGDALAVLRVLKPDEPVKSIAGTQANAKPGDVLVTFRNFKIAGFTVTVPLIGKLQFVAI
jgi:hypothetical protein